MDRNLCGGVCISVSVASMMEVVGSKKEFQISPCVKSRLRRNDEEEKKETRESVTFILLLFLFLTWNHTSGVHTPHTYRSLRETRTCISQLHETNPFYTFFFPKKKMLLSRLLNLWMEGEKHSSNLLRPCKHVDIPSSLSSVVIAVWTASFSSCRVAR